MQTQDIIYQHSPQFLPKIAIKLENLLASIHEGCQETHPIIHHYALKNVVELLKIIDKPELKSRITKEFLRLNYVLPAEFKSKHPELYRQFEQVCQDLQLQTHRFGNTLHQDPFLVSLRMRSQEQWHECELQAPYLLNWLHQNPKMRQSMIASWLHELKSLQATIQTYTAILRALSLFETITVSQSFYQRSLMANPPCQLIIIKLAVDLPVVPKFQLSPHALTIHFNDIQRLDYPSQLSFELQLGIIRI